MTMEPGRPGAGAAVNGGAPGSGRAGPGRIRGTFVDFSELPHRDHDLLGWTEEEWTEELTDMRAAGIELVIMARTMRFGCTYYFSDVFETHRETDVLSPFMRACARTGMQVFL